MDLLSLPVLIIENILSFLPYDEIAKARMVSRDLDAICQRLLNRGFVQIERRHALSLRSVKARLPRRESERRLHQLSRHCDILSAIETRISMLNMTYSKFIEHKICCFIPGKVIDEIKRVLEMVEREETPPRAHEVLQELRDISSMAIEHFDEKVSPALRRRLQQAAGHDRQHGQTNPNIELVNVKQLTSMCALQRRSAMNARFALLLSERLTQTNKKMLAYCRIAVRERAIIRALTAKVSEQGAAIAELKKRVDECDIKYTELTHTNQAVGGKAIPRTPNIKPRKPVIRLPSISEEDSDEPKAKKPKPDESPNEEPSTSKASGKPKKPSIKYRMKKLERELVKDLAPKKKDVNIALLGKRKMLACLEHSMDLKLKIPKID